MCWIDVCIEWRIVFALVVGFTCVSTGGDLLFSHKREVFRPNEKLLPKREALA